MKVQLDPLQLAEMGITEDISINLPPGFEAFTPSQRRKWARGQIEAIAMEVLADLTAGFGVMPSAAQKAAYLRSVRPGIDEALTGGTR